MNEPTETVHPETQDRYANGRFREGNAFGPGRPKNGGRVVLEHVNDFIANSTPFKELREIAEDDLQEPAKVLAAIWILTSREYGDLADYEEWLVGTRGLRDLRDTGGLNTRLVKRAKIKRIPTRDGMGEEREIELHDRAREALYRMIDYTDGKPTQRIDVSGPPSINLNISTPGLRFLPPALQKQLLPATEAAP